VLIDKHPTRLSEALHPGLLGGIKPEQVMEQPRLRSAVRSDDINPTQPLCGGDVIKGACRIDVSDAVSTGDDGDHLIHRIASLGEHPARTGCIGQKPGEQPHGVIEIDIGGSIPQA
jgi:hypothetical protein